MRPPRVAFAVLALALAVAAAPPTLAVAQQASVPASAPTAWWAPTSTTLDTATRCGVDVVYDHLAQAFVDGLFPDQQQDTLSLLLSDAAASWAHARLDSLRTALAADVESASQWSAWRVVGANQGHEPVLLATELTLLTSAGISVSDRVEVAYRFTQTDTGWQVGDARVFDSARHTLDPAAVQPVREAFSAYLDRLEAVAGGDSGDLDSLGEVMAGEELASERQAIDDLRSAGKARRFTPNLRVQVFDVRGDEAWVSATGPVHGVDIDLETGQEIADTAGDATWQQGYRLERQDGTWKVVHRGAFDQGDDQLPDCGSSNQ